MTVRVYTWEDEGAPELIMNNPSGYTSFGLERLKQILKACLVDGYGDKEPAGWTMGHEVEGGFSLFNGDNYFAFVHQGNSSWLRVYTLDDITDGSNPIPEGPNRRSGHRSEDYPSGTPMHFSCAFSLFAYSTRFIPRWVVVADEKTVYVNYEGYHVATPPTAVAQVTDSYKNAFGFGRAINNLEEPMGFFTGGALSTSYATPYPWSWEGANMMVSNNPTTGDLDQGSDPYVGPMNFAQLSSNSLGMSSISSSSLFNLQLGWYRGNSGTNTQNDSRPAGRLRGIFGLYPINGLRWDRVYELLAQTTLDELWDAPMRSIEFNGKQYIASGLWSSPYRNLALISLDEGDWV